MLPNEDQCAIAEMARQFAAHFLDAGEPGQPAAGRPVDK